MNTAEPNHAHVLAWRKRSLLLISTPILPTRHRSLFHVLRVYTVVHITQDYLWVPLPSLSMSCRWSRPTLWGVLILTLLCAQFTKRIQSNDFGCSCSLTTSLYLYQWTREHTVSVERIPRAPGPSEPIFLAICDCQWYVPLFWGRFIEKRISLQGQDR